MMVVNGFDTSNVLQLQMNLKNEGHVVSRDKSSEEAFFDALSFIATASTFF